MGKLAVLFALAVLICAIEQSSGMGTYYWTYPGAQSGALAYPAPVPYQPYQQFAPYAAFVPVDCDENKVADEGSDSGSSSSSSSSEESGEAPESGGSEEEAKPEEGGSDEATESGEAAPEGEGGEEGGSSEGSEESKSSSESGEEEKKTKKEEKPAPLFPPITYNFPARPVQQYVYSAPISQFMPLRTYSVVQQQPAYPVKSINSYYGAVPVSGGYNAPVGYNAAVGYNAPVVSGPMNGPTVVKSYSPVTRLVSSAVTRVIQSPVSYVPSNSYTYWNPSGNLGYYKK